MSRRSRSLPLLVALACAVAAAPAHAHARLISTSPASGATVAPPDVVTLTFDDIVQPPADAIRVTGPGAAAVPVRVAQPDTRKLEAQPRGKLAPGGYTVRWRVVSDDGHIKSGSFAFRVSAGARQATSAGAPGVQDNARKNGAAAVVLTLVLSTVTIAAIAAALTRLRRERAVRR